MSESFTTPSAPPPFAAASALLDLAAGALRPVVEAGAGILVREPWRVERIIADAGARTFGELAAEVAARRRAPPADFNRAIALAQLSLALAAPGFAAAWAEWRAEIAE